MQRILIILIAVFSTLPASGQWSVEVESGLSFQSYNDVRIPNQSGTTFGFNEDFELQGPVIPFRLRLNFTFYEKNHFSALFAPLALDYEGSAPFDIQFQSTLFEQGEYIRGFYKFNSYRLGYRRDFLQTENWTLGIGFTTKIRDARVKLSTAELSDKKDDLGFVPLLNIYAAYHHNNLTFWLDGDGLAGGPGRAFDVFMGAKGPLLDNKLLIKGGYRLLEGGADVSDVYNFTLVHFAVLGLIWNFY